MSSLPSPDPAPFPVRATHCTTCHVVLAWTAAQRALADRRPVGFLDEDDRAVTLCDRCARAAGLSDTDAA